MAHNHHFHADSGTDLDHGQGNGHGHEISHLPELDRRSLLLGAGAVASLGLLSMLARPASAHAATTGVTKLPGFDAFASSIKVMRSGKYYLVESSGLPAHNMMVGIKSWQQQVPNAQSYTGTRAWSIPATPVMSKAPMSAKNHFLRGAIALAVNGVPIFNALNNRGDDAYLSGELDNWGGHCGRADDYHYHVAPLHLQSIIGRTSPIAYALDGYPIYGTTEPDGSAVVGLDEFNGHFDKKKKYHYHGTSTYPYINGGFKGVVSEVEGQVSPQPSANPYRDGGEPLRGAVVTNFVQTGPTAYDLTYDLNGGNYHVRYATSGNEMSVDYVDPQGAIRHEVYTRRNR